MERKAFACSERNILQTRFYVAAGKGSGEVLTFLKGKPKGGSMTDGQEGSERFDAIKEIHKIPYAPTVPEFLIPDVFTNLKSPHPYRVLFDDDLDPDDDLVKVTPEAYKKIFPNSREEKDYRDKPATLFVQYTSKFLLWKITQKPKIPVYLNKHRQQVPKRGFIDGKRIDSKNVIGDDFTSSILISSKLKQKLDPYLAKGQDNYSIITTGINADKISIITGMWFSHPKRDVNLGWIFFYISAVLTALMFVVGLTGDGWHWADHFRHWAHDIKQATVHSLK